VKTRYAVILGSLLFITRAIPSLGSDHMEVERGERVFNQCRVCHTLDSSGNPGVGPNLYGIVGKKVGRSAKRADFVYSKALLDTKVTWTEDNLDRFIKDPAAFSRGTAMAFSGIKGDEDRKALIKFLKTAPLLQANPAQPR
jgi:cytochrome c